MIEIDLESLKGASGKVGTALESVMEDQASLELTTGLGVYSRAPGLQHAFAQHSAAVSGSAGSGTETIGNYSSFFAWIGSNLKSFSDFFDQQEQANAKALENAQDGVNTVSRFAAYLADRPKWSEGALAFTPPTGAVEAATPLAALLPQFSSTNDAAVEAMVDFWNSAAKNMNSALTQLASARSDLLSSNQGSYIDGAVDTLDKVISRGQAFEANATSMATFVGTIPGTRKATLTALELIQAETALILNPVVRLAVQRAEIAALMTGPYQAGLTASVPPITDLSQPPTNGSSATVNIGGNDAVHGTMNSPLNNVGAQGISAANTVAASHAAGAQVPPQLAGANAMAPGAAVNPVNTFGGPNGGGYNGPFGGAGAPTGGYSGVGGNGMGTAGPLTRFGANGVGNFAQQGQTFAAAGTPGQQGKMSLLQAMTGQYPGGPLAAPGSRGAGGSANSNGPGGLGSPGQSGAGQMAGYAANPRGFAGSPGANAGIPGSGHSPAPGATSSHGGVRGGSGTAVMASPSKSGGRGTVVAGSGGRHNRNHTEPGVEAVRIHPIELAANARELVGELPLTTPRVIGEQVRG